MGSGAQFGLCSIFQGVLSGLLLQREYQVKSRNCVKGLFVLVAGAVGMTSACSDDDEAQIVTLTSTGTGTDTTSTGLISTTGPSGMGASRPSTTGSGMGASRPSTTGSGGATGGSGGSGSSTGGKGGAATGGAGGAPAAAKVIFLTSSPTKINKIGGISGADAACEAGKAGKPAGTYKALITDGSARIACTTPNCSGGVGEHKDWVLAANTKYQRPDSTVIGTTNARGIFTFPLTNSISTNGGFAYWTGLKSDWTSDEHCLGWTTLSQVEGATQGLDNETNSSAIQGSSVSCASIAGAFFACVQQ